MHQQRFGTPGSADQIRLRRSFIYRKKKADASRANAAQPFRQNNLVKQKSAQALQSRMGAAKTRQQLLTLRCERECLQTTTGGSEFTRSIRVQVFVTEP